jgi:hypothetical protein
MTGDRGLTDLVAWAVGALVTAGISLTVQGAQILGSIIAEAYSYGRDVGVSVAQDIVGALSAQGEPITSGEELTEELKGVPGVSDETAEEAGKTLDEANRQIDEEPGTFHPKQIRDKVREEIVDEVRKETAGDMRAYARTRDIFQRVNKGLLKRMGIGAY